MIVSWKIDSQITFSKSLNNFIKHEYSHRYLQNSAYKLSWQKELD